MLPSTTTFPKVRGLQELQSFMCCIQLRRLKAEQNSGVLPERDLCSSFGQPSCGSENCGRRPPANVGFSKPRDHFLGFIHNSVAADPPAQKKITLQTPWFPNS